MADPRIRIDALVLADHVIRRYQADLAEARRVRISAIILCLTLGAIGGGVAGFFLAERVLPQPEPVVVEVCDGR